MRRLLWCLDAVAGFGSMYSMNRKELYKVSEVSLSNTSEPSGGSILALSGMIVAGSALGLTQLREACHGCLPTSRQLALRIMYLAIATGFTLLTLQYQSRIATHFVSVYRW